VIQADGSRSTASLVWLPRARLLPRLLDDCGRVAWRVTRQRPAGVKMPSCVCPFVRQHPLAVTPLPPYTTTFHHTHTHSLPSFPNLPTKHHPTHPPTPQSHEGGIGGEPWNEAHGGYTFCGLAAAALLGQVRVTAAAGRYRVCTREAAGGGGAGGGCSVRHAALQALVMHMSFPSPPKAWHRKPGL
jgi:hypothetical protein